MLHSSSSVLQTKLKTLIFGTILVVVLYFIVIFRQEKFIDSIETKRLKMKYFLLTVCTISASK